MSRARPGFPVRLDRAAGTPAVGGLPGAGLARGTQPAPSPVQAHSSVGHLTRATRPAASHGLDSHAVRQAMVKKLAAQGIHDARVLEAMGRVERHRFVDTALAPQAYEDTSLPIGLGQTISKPNVVARMIELLLDCPALAHARAKSAQDNERSGGPALAGGAGRVLEIGTGCGYQAAVLSCVAREVYSIERLRGLHEKARENMRGLRLPNVHLLFGDGMAGYAAGAPYAGIIAAAGGEAVPQAWVDQLAEGGRLVAPVLAMTAHGGASGASTQALLVLDKTAEGLRHTLLEAVHFVPLKSGIA
ncbi:protein-L-isoaspartate O-methyltransferase family protein [Hylemonella gracilis]|nr:protein-L-isoaspartate O-methyltransferase [Hylemonella gracilis]